MVALAAAEGAEMEAVVFVKGSALGSCVGTSNVPVDTEGVIIGRGEAKTRAAFCPSGLTVGEFCDDGGFEVEKDVVSLLCADKADGGGGRFAAA